MTHNKQEFSNGKANQSAIATAHANIAVIKYWGKRSVAQNLPAVGSISLTLDALKTETVVRFDKRLTSDYFELNGENVDGKQLNRLSNFLDIAVPSDSRPKAEVISTNNFPTGAGLASSASGFAALALAASRAAGQNLNKKELSKLARKGSGSAARSVYGGFVEMKCGGKDDYAVQLANQDYWNIHLLVAVTSEQPKSVGSTEGMNRTKKTSPFYTAWVEAQPDDLEAMRNAIQQKDFERVGELTEYSCFKMHGLALSAQPSLLYWNATTVKIIQTVRNLRKSGIPAYITIDAGPQVKILSLPEFSNEIKQAISEINGLKRLWVCKPGPEAALISRQKAHV